MQTGLDVFAEIAGERCVAGYAGGDPVGRVRVVEEVLGAVGKEGHPAGAGDVEDWAGVSVGDLSSVESGHVHT